MSTLLYTSESFQITHLENINLLKGDFLHCVSSDQYISAISVFKTFYEKTKSPYTLWDNSTFQHCISDKEKDWTNAFLNKPCIDMGFVKKVAIIISPETSGFNELIKIFGKESAGFWPGFYLQEAQAMEWIANKDLLPQDPTPPKITIKEATENKVQLNIEINADELTLMMRQFKNLLSDQNGIKYKYACFQKLTKQERQVLLLVLNGFYNKEIAEKLCLSIETIKTHRKNINQKLECRHLSELYVYKIFL